MQLSNLRRNDKCLDFLFTIMLLRILLRKLFQTVNNVPKIFYDKFVDILQGKTTFKFIQQMVNFLKLNLLFEQRFQNSLSWTCGRVQKSVQIFFACGSKW